MSLRERLTGSRRHNREPDPAHTRPAQLWTDEVRDETQLAVGTVICLVLRGYDHYGAHRPYVVVEAPHCGAKGAKYVTLSSSGIKSEYSLSQYGICQREDGSWGQQQAMRIITEAPTT
jgi:hypothetical protein